MIAKKQPYKIISYPNRRKTSRVIPNKRHPKKLDENIAATLLAAIGGDVRFLPELHIPNIKNPDCEWRGVIWEIKTLHGDNYRNTRDAAHNASKQSQNIIINAYCTKRDLNRIAMDIYHYLTTDKVSCNIEQILILGKKEYSLIKRSMLK